MCVLSLSCSSLVVSTCQVIGSKDSSEEASGSQGVYLNKDQFEEYDILFVL